MLRSLQCEGLSLSLLACFACAEAQTVTQLNEIRLRGLTVVVKEGGGCTNLPDPKPEKLFLPLFTVN